MLNGHNGAKQFGDAIDDRSGDRERERNDEREK